MSVVRCHMSGVRCHLSGEIFHLSPLTCHLSHVTNANSNIHWTISVKSSPVIFENKTIFNGVSKSNLIQEKKIHFFCIYHNTKVTKDQYMHDKIFHFNYVKFWKNCFFWIAMESGSESVTYTS